MAISNRGYRQDRLCDLATSMGRSGDRKGALEVLEEAETIMEGVNDVTDKLTMKYRLAVAYANIKESAKAIAIASGMDGDRSRSWTIAGVIHALVRNGEGMKALSSIPHIHDEEYKTKAMTEVAHHRASAGDVQGALEWIVNDPSREIKSAALESIAQGILEWVKAKEKENEKARPSPTS